MERGQPGAARAAGVGAGGATAAAALGLVLAAVGPTPAAAVAGLRAAGHPRARVEALLTDAAALGAWAALGWLSAVVLLTVLGRAPGATGRLADAAAARVTPTVLRRGLQAALGVTLVTTGTVGVTGPAAATGPTGAPSAAVHVLPDLDRPHVDVPDLDRPSVPGPGLDGPDVALPDLDRPSAGPAPATPDGPAASPAAPTPATATVGVPASPAVLGRSGRPDHREAAPEVVVVRGDTLWDIAARHLPTGAGDAEVSAAWQRWWAANRAVVGPDPDVLRPGQLLRPPA